VALVCLCMLLTVSFAAPIHKHDSGQEASCLLCHATERATIVPIARGMGNPIAAPSTRIAASFECVAVLERPDRTRTPRAPPANSFIPS
jgi:hypothetical protein